MVVYDGLSETDQTRMTPMKEAYMSGLSKVLMYYFSYSSCMHTCKRFDFKQSKQYNNSYPNQIPVLLSHTYYSP